MKKLKNEGFAHIGLLMLVLVIIAGVIAAGYYVYNKRSGKTTPSSSASSATGSSSASKPEDQEANHLEIKAIGVKIKDPDNRGLKLHSQKICAAECATEDSHFIRDDNSAYFARCEYPAGVSKLDEAGVQDIKDYPNTYMAKHSKKVGDKYYYVFPGSHIQSACEELQSGDEQYEEEIRQYILDNLYAL